MRFLFKLLVISSSIIVFICIWMINIEVIKIGGKSQFGVNLFASPYSYEKQHAENSGLRSPWQGSQSKPNAFRVIGYSVQGKPIRAFFWGEGHTNIYILGAIHGNEGNSGQLVERTIKLLGQNINQKNKAVTFIMIPCLNPDAVYSNHRTNANGVDLNRNFPFWDFDDRAKRNRYYRSSMKILQPETLALLQVCTIYPPALIFSIHQPFNLINYDGPAETIALDVQRINGMRIESNLGYITLGSLGTYFGNLKKIPVITIELPHTRKGKVWEDLLDRNSQAIIYSALNWQANRTK